MSSHFIAHPKENLVKLCFSGCEKVEPATLFSQETCGTESALSLGCSIRAIRVEGETGLLSRVTYPLARSHTCTGRRALHYAEMVNHLLVYSQVFVVQDIDGDRSYSLQMDTLLSAPCNRRSIARFIDNVEQDITVLIRYCKSKTAKESDDENEPERKASPFATLWLGGRGAMEG